MLLLSNLISSVSFSSDFPGGEGESTFKGRGVPDDVASVDGRRLLGLTKFEVPTNATDGVVRVIDHANATLF